MLSNGMDMDDDNSRDWMNRMVWYGMGWVEAGLDKGKNVNRGMINVKANDINNRIEFSVSS